MRSRRKLYRWAALFLCLALFAGLCCVGSYASDETSQTVRVGYYESSRFQEGASDSRIKSGYSYEYLQAVSHLTGWEYEYVYGGWSELYEMLLAGEIDLLAGVSVTEERIGKILYPDDAMGVENYYLYKHEDDSSISAADPASLNGKKIAGQENNLITTSVLQWAGENGITPEIVWCDSDEACREAFYAGQVDCIAATDNNVTGDMGMQPVVCVGGSDYYLAVAVGREDLLAQLNDAQSSLGSAQPYFKSNLQYKYFGQTAAGAALTDEEEAWVSEHESLRVGYIADYMPFCGQTEDGEADGIVTDVMSMWLEKLGLEDRLRIEYIPYDTYDAMEQGLHTGEIDVLFPQTGSMWHSERNNIWETDQVVDVPVSLIFSGEYTASKVRQIAISGHSPLQRVYVQTNYPDAGMVIFDSDEACLQAVTDGLVDSTVFSGYRAEYFLRQDEYASLRSVSLNESSGFAFGVQSGNTTLLSLMNRGIGMLDSAVLSGSMFNYVNYESEYTIADFAREHVGLILLSAGLFFLLIVGCLLLYIGHERKSRKILQARDTALEAAHKEAMQANEAKSRFLFNMSHDIRTPMNAVLGFSQLMEKELDRPEALADHLGKVRQSGEYLLSIIDNVLDMARIESGKIEPENAPTDLEQIVRGAADMFTEELAEKDLCFSCTAEFAHPYVMADGAKLQRIIVNLLGNAVKYTPREGSVCLRASERAAAREGFAEYAFMVSDTGIGMSEEFRAQLFDVFSRERTSTESRVSGTGLGMSIVKKLVDMMDGDILVESEPGQGSVFTVTLPLQITEPPQAENTQKESGLSALRGMRVLLAEDNDINAEIAMELLEDCGIVSERASDGEQCVRMLQAAPAGYYDLILMDVQMPNMDGHAAARAVRALPDAAKAEIPIVAMTANAFEEDRKQALQSGMNGFVAKPVDMDELTAAILAAKTV